MARLVYLDTDIVVLDKAPGEAVTGRHRSQRRLLAEWRDICGSPALQPAHRIDQPVAGLVLLARHSEAFTAIQQQFADNSAERIYLAVVSAPPDPAAGTLRDGISVEQQRNVSTIDPAGKSAELSYETIGSTDHHSVVRVRLKTGRHHQIRVQLAARGWHVVGDTKYGARRPLRDGGIALLAAELSFDHPSRPGRLRLRARPPETALWTAVREVVHRSPSPASGAG